MRFPSRERKRNLLGFFELACSEPLLAVFLGDLARRSQLDGRAADLLVEALGGVVVFDVVNDLLAVFLNADGALAFRGFLQFALRADTLTLEDLLFVSGGGGGNEHGRSNQCCEGGDDFVHGFYVYDDCCRLFNCHRQSRAGKSSLFRQAKASESGRSNSKEIHPEAVRQMATYSTTIGQSIRSEVRSTRQVVPPQGIPVNSGVGGPSHHFSIASLRTPIEHEARKFVDNRARERSFAKAISPLSPT